MTKSNARIYPLPEIISDGWKITHGKVAGVNFDKKEIRVPLDATDGTSHCIRMQQIAKIKWNDGTKLDMTSLVTRSLEEFRVNHLLDDTGIDMTPGTINEDLIKTLENYSADTANFALLMLGEGSKYAARIHEVVRSDQLKIVAEQAMERIRENPTKANVLETASWVLKYVTDTKVPKPMLPPPPPSSDKNDAGLIDYDAYYELGFGLVGDDDRLQELPAAVRAHLPTAVNSNVATTRENWKANPRGFTKWGKFTVEEPGRPIVLNGKFTKVWKHTEEGVFPRYPHRFAVDQRVFAKRVKIPGGTVIIDHSGSMGLTPDQVDKIIEYAPGCTVASYSGNYDDGVIRILAKKGRRVTNELCDRPAGGANVIDFHGLAWAYKLSHPRIWVSDMVVTGVGDASGAGNFAMCEAILKKGRFFQGQHVAEAIEILKRLGKHYKGMRIK